MGRWCRDAGGGTAVPQFAGSGVARRRAGCRHASGLRVQTLGSGLAKEHFSVSGGTMVPMGTQVVVRFVR